MSKKEVIRKNIAQWKANQQRKAHMSDKDCPIDNAHVQRARAVSQAIQDWVVSQRKMLLDSCKKNPVEFTFKPFKF